MNIQLTISLLVSDRMETLGKCLASLKPLLRELDSELIVVFTGKNEETLELVRQYTSHIIPFEWCNDFSKARNAGLKEGKGEWFLYLDDDEWFENIQEIIQFFKSGEYRHYGAAFYVQHNYLDLEGKRYSDADVGRMCRLTPETKFIFPIHENLVPFEEPCKKLTAFVHHFGYARKENLKEKDTKTGRNLPLLLEMYEKNPDSPQCCMQIAQEYRSVGEFEKAAEYCRKGLSLARKEERIYNYELWMQVNLPRMISYTGDFTLAMEEGEQIIKHPRTLEAGALHLSITLVSLCRRLEEYRKGLKYVRLYHEKLSDLQKHPEKAARQRAAGLTLDLAVTEMAPVYIDGLFFSAQTDDFEAARQILPWIPWDNQESVAAHYPRLEEWKREYHEKGKDILMAYDRLVTENPYVRIQKVLYAERQKHLEKAEKLWGLCVGECPSGFQWELIEIAVRNQFSLKPVLERMTPEEWNEYAEMVVERKEWAEMQEFYQNILPLLEEFPFYRRKLEQSFLVKNLTCQLLEPSKMLELFHQYCASVCSEFESLYKEEVLAKPKEYALPTRYRFAVILKGALQLMEEKRIADSFPVLEEAVRIYPRMSAAISQLLRYLEEQLEASMQNVSEEFTILGAQVKQVLRGFIDSRQWEEAYSVAVQLMSLLPDDLEVLRMKQEIMRQRTSI